MGYRGDDLDLRTPQTWTTSPADLGSDTRDAANGVITQAEARRAPIWVDETVLACANHAYDVALAHRASEVRLEHFLHALTRIDAAAEALEARGIRVTGLRRETGTIVASEIPIGFANGKSAPVHSDAMEAVLRAASSSAARRREPGTVDDALDVLLDGATDLPGLDLLHRHRVWVTREQSSFAPSQRLSTFSLPPLAGDEKGDAMPSNRRRNSRSAYANDPSRRSSLDPFSPTLDSEPPQTMRQDRRDDGALRGFGEQLRRDFDQQVSSVHVRLQAIEQFLNRLGDGAPSQIIERVAGVEAAVNSRLTEVSRATGEQSVRLAKLEQGLRDATVDNGRSSIEIRDQLKALDQSLPAKAAAAVDLKPIGERISSLEKALLGSGQRPEVQQLIERLTAVETQAAQHRAATTDANLRFSQEIKALTSAFGSQAASGERLQSYISDRVTSFGAMLERQRAEIETSVAAPLVARAAALATQFDQSTAQHGRSMAGLTERLQGLERALLDETQRSQDAGAALSGSLEGLRDVLVALDERQQNLAKGIDDWRLDEMGDLSVVGNRLAAIEQANIRPARTIEAIGQTVDNLYRALQERDRRRNRFWIWLFGTNDWIGASWPAPDVPPPPPPRK